jgi:hypothetical protein
MQWHHDIPREAYQRPTRIADSNREHQEVYSAWESHEAALQPSPSTNISFSSFRSLPDEFCEQTWFNNYEFEALSTEKLSLPMVFSSTKPPEVHDACESPETPQLSPPSTTTSFSPFPYLPPELREQIWLSSFQPRVLCLHIDVHVEPVGWRHNCTKDPPPGTRAIWVNFECTVPFNHPAIEFDERYSERLERFERREIPFGARELPFATNKLFSRGDPSIPAALFVCHESRQLALGKYERAFGRVVVDVDNAFLVRQDRTIEIRMLEHSRLWNERSFGKKRSWVNFEQDIVVVEIVSRNKGSSKSYIHVPSIDQLGMIRSFAAEEGRKIRKLAIEGRQTFSSENRVEDLMWGPLREVVLALQGGNGYLTSGFPRHEYLLGFNSLDDIFLDSMFKGDMYGSLELDRARTEILNMLEVARSQSPGLISKVPNVTVLKEGGWEEFL